jgi:Ran GTPase-activating protein (RanGAP) involved in mRNA processing and transport
MDCVETDPSDHLPDMGIALGENTKLEVLSMRECKAKSTAHSEFWKNIKPNRKIRIINFERSRLTDRVAAAISEYLLEEGIVLAELNLNRNLFTGKGLIQLSLALQKNKSLTKLFLGRNEFEEEGLDVFAASLVQNTTLEELSVSENQINNVGIIRLA